MDALDERVLRDDESVAELGRVVLDPAREAPPLELGQQAELAELREPHRSPPAAARSAAARITATPAAPARMQSAALETSTPPIATTGIETASQISREPVEPDRRIGVRLGRRRPDRAGADVAGAERLARAAPRRPRRRRVPSSSPARDRALDALVVAAEVDAVGTEPKRRLDVVVDDERGAASSRNGAPSSTSSSVRRVLAPQLDDGRAAVDRDARRREVLDDRVQLHRAGAQSSFSGSSA